ncbi:MAG: hypothetical protein R2942_02280 [Ignavibacteria bacterium]
MLDEQGKNGYREVITPYLSVANPWKQPKRYRNLKKICIIWKRMIFAPNGRGIDT